MKKFVARSPEYQHLPVTPVRSYARLYVASGLHCAAELVRLSRPQWRLLRQTSMLRSSCEGPLLLVANGPTTRNLTGDLLQWFRRDCGPIALMNHAYETRLVNECQPDYYVVADPAFWTPDHEGLWTYLNTTKSCTVVQPVQLAPKYPGPSLFYNRAFLPWLGGRFSPLRPWAFAPSALLQALAMFHYLGFSPVYVWGADSDFQRYRYVDEANNLRESSFRSHFYSPGASLEKNETRDCESTEDPLSPSLRGMADALFADAVFMRDFHAIGRSFAVNVGGGDYSDALPRACLWGHAIGEATNTLNAPRTSTSETEHTSRFGDLEV